MLNYKLFIQCLCIFQITYIRFIKFESIKWLYIYETNMLLVCKVSFFFYCHKSSYKYNSKEDYANCICLYCIVWNYFLCFMIKMLYYLRHTVSKISFGFIDVSWNICNISCFISICCCIVSSAGWLCGDFKIYVPIESRINIA